MSDRAVADATVLIYLAKIGRLDSLADVFDAVVVPDAVYAECVERGRAEGYRDALAIDSAVDASFERRGLGADADAAAEELASTAGLGAGESVAITLAMDLEARCLTDDHAARTTAEALGIPVGGTIYVLLRGHDEGSLTTEAYHEAIDALAETSFRMDASLYRAARSATSTREA